MMCTDRESPFSVETDGAPRFSWDQRGVDLGQCAITVVQNGLGSERRYLYFGFLTCLRPLFYLTDTFSTLPRDAIRRSCGTQCSMYRQLDPLRSLASDRGGAAVISGVG